MILATETEVSCSPSVYPSTLESSLPHQARLASSRRRNFRLPHLMASLRLWLACKRDQEQIRS